MSITPDWRSATAADELNRLDRAGFAQEFLRRNQDYQEDYRRMIRLVEAGTMSEEAATSVLALRWGLSFRVRSNTFGGPCAGAVAARACC
ncbi:MAG TPA: DUF6499 domain-containing protein [Rhizomicrobium sp.]|nr:DUF6499 domain-containing protein [Rhizomicrobium sp.]